MPFTSGNRAGVLKNGPKTFEAIFEEIGKATDYVLVQFFIIDDDEIGRELKSRLAAKARQGVRVGPLLYQGAIPYPVGWEGQSKGSPTALT